ncbi:hypothetical protein [Calidifontibacillus erzurumensis]|uniref:Uncharacterized protein n=1 Tax=Calidifontibacillus erzurumensis TaxID=2741433 RepID=A0A8J8GDQ4_9BACI|nr:hypothetical protein [Calidifontibacillus erzurumensis]NSL51979.1 hypothetical protein [Calidifontibacillus erzurumensis]
MEHNDREQEIQALLAKDSKYEGRDRYFMDVDRMINEGMAGGTVITRGVEKPIDDDRNMLEEEPPLELT